MGRKGVKGRGKRRMVGVVRIKGGKLSNWKNVKIKEGGCRW